MITVLIALGAGLVAGLLVHGACRLVASREGDMPKPEKPPKPLSFRREVLHRLGVMQQSIDRATLMVGALTNRVSTTLTREDFMAGEQAILDKVRAQSTVIEAVRALVQALKDNQDDPVKTAEILAALDANDAALAVVAGTPSEEPPTA
jgi:hypothetical protein